MRELNYEDVTRKLVSFIKLQVESSGLEGGIVGLSGGIDSSVTIALTVLALGKQRSLGLLMPEDFTPTKDMEDASNLAKSLEIRTEKINIHRILETYRERLMPPNDYNESLALANLRARVRMNILYFQANRLGYLVIGTGDKSEADLGYFTKYGDGGVDILPLGNLYKTEVRKLGRHLGLPENLVNKPSSPQLYPGHLAIQELPAEYETLDPILEHLDTETSTLGHKAKAMYLRSEHKRRLPPIAQV